MSVGSTVRLCRTQKGLTQRVLASRAGINASYLSQLELDKRDPALSTLKRLSKALDVPMTLLLFLAGDTDDIAAINPELAEKLSNTLIMLMKEAASNAKQSSFL